MATDTDTTTISRRAIFGGAGKIAVVAAFAGLPVIASAQPNRSAWEAAMTCHSKALLAQEAYERDVLMPLDAKHNAARMEMPKFTMPAGFAGDEGNTKPHAWNDATLRKFGGDEDKDNDSPLAIFARQSMVEINRIDAHNGALWVRLDYDRVQDEFDRLVEVASDARGDMLATPAPDIAALAFKLKSLVHNEHLISDNPDDESNPLSVLIADPARLARGALS